MKSRSKESVEAAFDKVKEESMYFKRKLETFFMLFVMFLIAAVSLWLGTHKFFSLLTDSWAAEEAIKGKNIKDLWNVLMYFVPFLLFSLSMGCLTVCAVFGLLHSLSYTLDFVGFQSAINNQALRTSVNTKDTGNNGGGNHEN